MTLLYGENSKFILKGFFREKVTNIVLISLLNQYNISGPSCSTPEYALQHHSYTTNFVTFDTYDKT